MEKMVTFQEALSLAKRLSLLDRVCLIEQITSDIKRELMAALPAPWKSLWGLRADLGAAPSGEDIDRARQEEWANFPRGASDASGSCRRPHGHLVFFCR
jgi:hypothetical protein